MGHDGIKGIIESGKAPGTPGLSRGPQSSTKNFGHQTEILRPDPYHDCRETFRRIDRDGKMTPELRKFATEKMIHLKNQHDRGLLPKTDLDKIGGHRLEKDM